MHAHVSLLGIALLPLLAGVFVLGCAPWWERWFGPERATGVAGRFALGGTILAVFLLAAAIYGIRVRPDLPPTQPVFWGGVGYTTMLGLDLAIDGLVLLIGGYAVVVALATMLAGLVDVRGTRALGTAAALLGSTLMLAMAGTVWGAAIAWQISVLVAGTGPSGQGAEDRSRWRVSDAGVWLAVLATAVGAGDFGFELVIRGALFGELSPLVIRGMGVVAAVGLVVAVGARALGFAATVRGASTTTRAALHGLASTAGVLLLVRMHILLALAPTVLAVLAIGGGALAAGSAWLATRAADRHELLARVTQATLGLLLVGVGMGAWAPVCGLLVVHGLATAGLVLGGRAARRIAGVTLGLAPIGAGLWIGEIAGAGFVYMSAWSPAINVVVAGLVIAAAAGLGGAMGQVLRDRSRIDEVSAHGLYAGLGAGLAALAAVVAAIDVPVVMPAMRVWISPAFAASWLLQGVFALGPRPGYSMVSAHWGTLATVVAAWAGFWWLRGGAPVRGPRIELGGLQRGWLALCRGVHGIVEGRVIGLMLRPGEVQAGRAGGPPQPARALLGLLAGTIAVLATVYCNTDVVQVGPSHTYPVDAGGLDPALLGSRRPAEEE